MNFQLVNVNSSLFLAWKDSRRNFAASSKHGARGTGHGSWGDGTALIKVIQTENVWKTLKIIEKIISKVFEPRMTI